MAGERVRGGGRARTLALVCALAVGGCATPSEPPIAPPTPAERREAEAAGFELPPLRKASDLLAPDLLDGPHFRVEEDVYSDGLHDVFTITSDFGTFRVRGDDMLVTRLREIEALAVLDETSATSEFALAAGRALASPFVATWNLLTNPVDTITGVPKGAWESVRRTSQLAQGERGELEDNAFKELIGFGRKKRQIAAELGVDPYSSNKALQRELNRFAWAAYAGGLPSMFVPFVDDAADDESSGDAAAVQPDDRLPEILRQYSPEDLDRLNRIELAVMGVPGPVSEQFIAHPWYSPRHETVLVENLSALDLAADRRAFIEIALTAKSEDDAYFYQRRAELIRRYNDNVGRIIGIVSVEGQPAGYTRDAELVVPLAADHAIWSRSTASLARSLSEPLPGDVEVRKTKLLLSGTLSQKAREQLESRGVEVVEHAFERLAAAPAESGDSGE